MTTVGVIGLGDIGGGAATSVAAAGLDLRVCDVREEATARFAEVGTVAASPAALAAECDVVFVAVVNDAQVRAVVTGPDGALSGARAGSVIVVASTISPDTIAEVGAAARSVGVGLIDCGVSGGPSAAATGELICMVGGDDADIERARPALEAIGSLIVPMGPLGAGLIAKLARNVIQYGSWLAAYEGQRICEAAGIALADLAKVVKASDAKIGGPSTLMFRATVAPFGPEDHEGLVNHMRSAAALAHKDLQAALETAARLGVELPGARLTDAYADAIFGVGEVTP
ncbi:MAG: hypothetical protein RL531_177 [Actinomycetota bacterium]